MIAPGVQIGSYRVISPLGEGGMGVVFLAEHTALGRRVALKVLRPGLSQEPELVSRFFNEARAVNRIGNEHIVDVTDFGMTPSGETYFVMELLSGESLAQRLSAQGPFGWQRATRIAIQVAGALEASHQVGIIHRDLKPENVLLISRHGDRDYVKVLDFGVAKLLGEEGDQRSQTRSGMVVGTPYYMSPEQCLARPVDPRTDIYALGVMLYEMLTGQRPFEAPSFGELVLLHATQPFPEPWTRCPELPGELRDVLLRAVQKDREQRWPSMGPLRQALEEIVPPVRFDDLPAPVAAGRPRGDEPSGRVQPQRRSQEALAATVSLDGATSSPGIGPREAGAGAGLATSATVALAGPATSPPPVVVASPPASPPPAQVQPEVQPVVTAAMAVAAPPRRANRWLALIGTGGLAVGLVVLAVRTPVRTPPVKAASSPASPPAAAPSRPAAASAPAAASPPAVVAPPAVVTPPADAAGGAAIGDAVAGALPDRPAGTAALSAASAPDAGSVAAAAAAASPAPPGPGVAGRRVRPRPVLVRPGRPLRRPGSKVAPAAPPARPAAESGDILPTDID